MVGWESQSRLLSPVGELLIFSASWPFWSQYSVKNHGVSKNPEMFSKQLYHKKLSCWLVYWLVIDGYFELIDGYWWLLMLIDGYWLVSYWCLLMLIDGYWLVIDWLLIVLVIDGYWWIVDGYWIAPSPIKSTFFCVDQKRAAVSDGLIHWSAFSLNDSQLCKGTLQNTSLILIWCFELYKRTLLARYALVH